MTKVFNTILLIYLNFSLTSLKFVQTAVSDVKNPCEDFHEYVCSTNSQNVVEISQKLDSQFNTKLLGRLNKVIEKRKLSRLYHSEVETYFDKIVTYFEACRSTESDFGDYLTHFDHFITKRDVWPLLGLMQSYGLNNVIVNHHTTRNKNNSLNIILSPVDIAKGESLNSSDSLLQEILDSFGYPDKKEEQKLFDTSLKWRDIANKYNNSNNGSQEITLNTFNLTYPKLQLYLTNLLEAELDNLSVITVQNLAYFEFLNNREWSEEDLIYLIIKYLYYLKRDATKAFEPLECIEDLRNKFDLGLNYIYYHDFFKRNENLYMLSVLDMLHNIKGVMSKQFVDNHLNLSSKQIENLQKKLEAVKINIGNLPDSCNYTLVNTYYMDIPKLSSRKYSTNHLLLLKHRFRKSISYMEDQTYFSGTDSNTATTLSLPFYVLNKNMIVIPAASFQHPLFHHQQTPLELMSVLGFIMAHELTHAFDTWGLKFDHQGFQLITPSDILEHANFRTSVKCMQEQESTEYIHERIADLFAVRVVYRTYLECYAQGKEDDWSKEFFKNLAQFFCGGYNLQYIDHDSDSVRLHQIVKNFAPFAQTYKCPENSALNLKNKCRIY